MPGVSAHAAAPVGLPLARNRTLQVQVALFGLAWLAAAIAPCDRRTWLLENLLVVVGVAVLAASHRRFVFSNLSYSLIFVFLLMHVMGSHYTYSEVPLGAWLRDGLSLGRNHYDRLVHLCFGVLLAYPLRELVLRRLHLHGFGGYLVPVLAILSLSSSYEILESWAARVVDPATGMAFVGAQGDIWDGQKDMSLALAGALLAMLVAAACRRRFDREPYLMWRAHGAASGVPGRG
jgi:putative membrane protein